MEPNDNLYIQEYDIGINADRWRHWRDSGDIGYVHLSYRIIVEAMYDLICGDHEAILSASIFFFGDMVDNVSPKKPGEVGYGEESDPLLYNNGSLYPIYAQIIGYNDGRLPELVEKHRNGRVTTRDVENLRNLYTVMATI